MILRTRLHILNLIIFVMKSVTDSNNMNIIWVTCYQTTFKASHGEKHVEINENQEFNEQGYYLYTQYRNFAKGRHIGKEGYVKHCLYYIRCDTDGKVHVSKIACKDSVRELYLEHESCSVTAATPRLTTFHFHWQQNFWRRAKNKNDDQCWVSGLFNMPLICQPNWFTNKRVLEQPLNTMKRNGPRSATLSHVHVLRTSPKQIWRQQNKLQMWTINPCYDVTSDPVAEGSFIYSTSTVFTYKNFHSCVFRLFMGNKHKGFVTDVPQFDVCEMFMLFFTGFLWELQTSPSCVKVGDIFLLLLSSLYTASHKEYWSSVW